MSKTSWEKSHNWYNKIVGEKGHYYHQHIILPYLENYLKENKINSILDIGCGQGILSRIIPSSIDYVGIDISASLITEAKKLNKNKKAEFYKYDATEKFELEKKDFDLCIFILSIQNMKDPFEALKNASNHLKKSGRVLIIMNHPTFRIPRHSSWDINDNQNIQSRKINSYLSPLEIPIKVHPGKKDCKEVLYSYHFPLSYYSKCLKNANFNIDLIDELISDKKSIGKKARMENKARKEFPLFMALNGILIK